MTARSWLATLAALPALLTPGADAHGQALEVTGGVDLVSRYVWRGVPLSRPLNAQPWLSAEAGSLSAGTWGSHGFDGEYSEQDLWLAWHAGIPGGSLTLTLLDYYISDGLADYFRWGGVEAGSATGAHTLEVAVAYAGPEGLPVRALAAWTFYNDPGGSLYGEVGYDRSALGLDWSATAGGLLRDGGFYAVGHAGVTNLSVAASRTVATLAGRSLYARGTAVHNPELGDTYLIFGFGF